MRKLVAVAAAGVALTAVVGIGVAGAATGKGPAGPLAQALAGLVDDGTITQEQADKVSEAVTDAREEAVEAHRGRVAERRATLDKILQDTIGLTSTEVREKLAAGESLADIVGENDDELVAELSKVILERLDAAVAAGRLTQEQADKFAAVAEQRMRAVLSGEATHLRGGGLGQLLGGPGGLGGMRGPALDDGGHRHGFGHHGWDDVPAPEASDEPSSTSTTGA